MKIIILVFVSFGGWCCAGIMALFLESMIRRWKRDDKTIECLRGVLENIGRDITILDMEAYAKEGLNYGNECPCGSSKLFEDCCAGEYEKYHVG